MNTMNAEKKSLAMFTNKWYDHFMECSPTFKNMSMDEQGELCIKAAKEQIKQIKESAKS